MLGDKALELIKHLKRCDYLSPLQDETMKQVYEEMKALFEENQLDVNASINGEIPCHAAVQLRHSVLLRDKRCILSYLFNRLQMVREIRWSFGSVLPQDVRSCMSEAERKFLLMLGNLKTAIQHLESKMAMMLPQTSNTLPEELDQVLFFHGYLGDENNFSVLVNWFTNYNRMVANYMSQIGNIGVDLFTNLQPPKSLYVQVRCLCDYGDFETSEGDTVILAKNCTHLLPRTDCEKLIHQGILEHIAE